MLVQARTQEERIPKKDKEDMMPNTAFFSKLKRVGDTNIGTMNIIQLRDKLMDQAAKLFQGNQDAYFTLLRQNWLHDGKKGVTKSSKFTRLDFKLKYGDLVVLLNQIMGVVKVCNLRIGCTILLMKLKMERENLIELGSYVKILELQLRTVQNQKQFHRGSYLFYLIGMRRNLKCEFG